MTRIGTIALLALLASAAAANDQAAYNASVLKHAACTTAAVVGLAEKSGSAHDLSLEALWACKAYEHEIAKLASPEVMTRVMDNARYALVDAIEDARSGPKMCATCGMRPHRDDLGVWRLYRK